MRDEDPQAVVEALIDAFNRRDGVAVAALLHDDIMCIGIPLPPARGKAAALDLLAPFLAAEAIDWQLHAIAVNGRTVHTERTDRFRFTGADWTQVRAAGIFEVAEDGRIRAWRDYFDMAELLAAMPASGSQDI
ncbi:limonene-1,2-epoxide hydrolase family protein [Sphingobium limneticum]|uniref:Limonene-1,2-epoxide hydrolase n=1 Tax=Sphingobium limneticum TaxID=1007511 RepID=A0A5J5I455_9SPHN|nr:limonene-1,2-epoxide hydrolase family protein [Sphingobium limneticum]KAA9018225.1 limonene-1,2-epoxide hydrolase [Sphingobium limneticum]KAA9030861.1 limonene-1,2-epoxide hydrolase [Sphingobium limneticum]